MPVNLTNPFKMKNTVVYCILIPVFFQACNHIDTKIDYTPHEYSEVPVYMNPVIKGFFPDPSICKTEKGYYLVTSSFEYYPGVPIFHSKDLVNWEQIGNVLDRESQLPISHVGISGGIFAPVIRYHDGLFYMITTIIPDGKNFIVTSEDPEGSWSDPILVDMKNIDPSLLFDDDGKVYYTGTSPWDGKSQPGIYQAEIDVKTGRLLTDYQLIWTGTGGRYPEGPHLYKIGNIYYLMISEGGTETGHFVTIARSESPWGPFESCPGNPILTNHDQPYSNPVQNSGHADLIQAEDGKWWLVHLAVRNVNKHHHLGRETFLLPVEWTDEGWPIVNKDGVSQIDIYAIPPAEQEKVNHYGEYEFDEVFGPEWNYIRNPELKNYSLDNHKSILRLKGSSYRLDDLASPTFIGIRQKDFKIDVTAKLNFQPLKDGEEAGITAFMTPEHFYTASIVRENGVNYAVSTMKIGMIKHFSGKTRMNSSEVYFRIQADSLNYSFYFSEDNKNWKLLGENYARLLSSETAGTFTGTYLGMYATGNGKECENYVEFDFFKYLN